MNATHGDTTLVIVGLAKWPVLEPLLPGSRNGGLNEEPGFATIYEEPKAELCHIRF
ncbi:MAG TPA: hypothetical protein VNZ64_13625 [Candidatus Acidoferrum sp.]|nr:hypothetical protein [Candidatus Acidoferrum sp.]